MLQNYEKNVIMFVQGMKDNIKIQTGCLKKRLVFVLRKGKL